jgi:hypothetical protein
MTFGNMRLARLSNPQWRRKIIDETALVGLRFLARWKRGHVSSKLH